MINFRAVAILFSSSLMLASLCAAQLQHEGNASIMGAVRDGSAAVADASVRLQAQGSAQAEERKTG